jgi:hypothetical protein
VGCSSVFDIVGWSFLVKPENTPIPTFTSGARRFKHIDLGDFGVTRPAPSDFGVSPSVTRCSHRFDPLCCVYESTE